ncbi:MAG: N-acetyl-gamma-glutamyl-phosphate reductase [Bacteroidetes bacterium]|nr:N-acetyl-gamma-glutamyl-phosphate reductase [Bacteroidota bacterium]
MPIEVSIAGGSGLVAGELLRLLVHHPSVSITSVASASQAGTRVAAAHDGVEDLGDLRFADAPSTSSDVLFLCLPHGEAEGVLVSFPPDERCTVIDLSRDHRTGTSEYLYGLPELHRDELAQARARGQHVANPGCFATAVQLGLLPLLREGLLRGDVHSSAVTGSTGAGRAALPTLHFTWRHDNMQVYQPFTHAHLDEIDTTIRRLQPAFEGKHFFIPYRGPFTRGIIATSYTPCALAAEDLRALYQDTFAGHPFTTVVDGSPALKSVVNTNHCHVWVDSIDGMCVAVSVIDNLLKGAAGQAVQNMNLLFGLDERSGLRLKASAF